MFSLPIFIECFQNHLSSSTAIPGPPPGSLHVAKVNRSAVHLSWFPTSDTGGSPLFGYVIEYRSEDDPMWYRISLPVINEYTVSGLQGKTGVQFRVRSVNMVGESEPLTAGHVFNFEDPKCK